MGAAEACPGLQPQPWLGRGALCLQLLGLLQLCDFLSSVFIAAKMDEEVVAKVEVRVVAKRRLRSGRRHASR